MSKCVCVYVFLKLQITAPSGPVTLVILCHSHWSFQGGINEMYMCVYLCVIIVTWRMGDVPGGHNIVVAPTCLSKRLRKFPTTPSERGAANPKEAGLCGGACSQTLRPHEFESSCLFPPCSAENHESSVNGPRGTGDSWAWQSTNQKTLRV